MEFDALIVTALPEELEPVLSLTETASGLSFTDEENAKWREDTDSNGLSYYYRTFTTSTGDELVIAAARASAMGPIAAADRCRALVAELKPLSVAMTGICAGRRDWVSLGDVIVADRVFSYDSGKYVATIDKNGVRVEEQLQDIETYNLKQPWKTNAASFGKNLAWLEKILTGRPLSLKVQEKWVLRTLLLHESGKGAEPVSHRKREVRCPRWPDVLERLQSDRSVTLKSGVLKLTALGRGRALNDRTEYPKGPKEDPPFKAHVGPIAAGAAVIQDPHIFSRIAKFQRKILGLEMESAAIGYVAENARIPSIIVKAVLDYADDQKDDSFRDFAARASAAFLVGFLRKYPPRTLPKERALDSLPELVSREHVQELHQMAKRKVDFFRKLLIPEWGARPQELGMVDADEELTALRQHFPQVNRDYAKWYALNSALAGIQLNYFVEKVNQWGIWGNEPADPMGKELLREHNAVVRDLIAELTEIQSLSSISGQCNYCNKATPADKAVAPKKAVAAKKAGPSKKVSAAKKTVAPKKVSAAKKTVAPKKVSTANKAGPAKKAEAPKKVVAAKKVSAAKKTVAPKKVSTANKAGPAKKAEAPKRVVAAKKRRTR
jgi:nucleoside phosphorylase